MFLGGGKLRSADVGDGTADGRKEVRGVGDIKEEEALGIAGGWDGFGNESREVIRY